MCGREAPEAPPDALDVEPLRISLEIERRAEPITGRLTLEGDGPRGFAGMLELIALIDGRRRECDGAGGG